MKLQSRQWVAIADEASHVLKSLVIVVKTQDDGHCQCKLFKS